MNELQKLIVRGLEGFFSATPSEMLRELGLGVATGKYKVFVSRFDGYCILALPQTPFEHPQVLHFYSENKAVTRKLVAQTLDFVAKRGYTKLLAVNGSGAPDAVWTRAFRYEGWRIKPVKTVFEFERV